MTPMLKNGDIDFAAFEKLLGFHADACTDGIVLVGTTGESATLNKDERAEIFAFANSKTDIPLMAGVGSSATAHAIQLIECALENNINECLAVTPYYNKPSQIGLELHYKELSKVGANITLYNVPGRTGVDLQPATVEKLLEIEKVTGIKEAVDTEQRFSALKRLKDKRHDFKLYSGDDPSLVKFMKFKGDGVISVAANVMPKEIKELTDVCLAGDFGKAEKIIKNYQEIFKLLFIEASPSPCKYLLEKMSLLENNLRLPLHPLSVEYREKIYEVFKNI